MGQIQLGGSILLIAIFTLAVLSFAIGFAQNNTTSISIADDPELLGVYTATGSSLENMSAKSQDEYESIINTTIPDGSDYPQSMGAFNINGKSYYQVFLNIVPSGLRRIFGNSPFINWVVGGALSFLLLVIGLYAYKTIRGLPD